MTNTFLVIIIISVFVSVLVYWLLQPKIRLPNSKDEENQLKIKENHYKLISEWLRTDKRFLDRNLKLDKVAQGVQLTERQVSSAINTIACQNFSSYINHLRIKESQSLLCNKSYEHYTIDAIAEMAGFANKVSFYKSFKKVTGLSPADYKKRIKRSE